MQFRALRLAGFKSFVEPVELEIISGLTGIVGPNGCGKSNLVEALRWVMGESSAKRMRGGEMDDVIFAGSSGRPARNIAEITLTIDNRDRTAPSVFNQSAEIEVRRRIERGAGSDYRVNGRAARARDVQLLFADAAIGASSPALVSQGRVAALIAAKPSERRFVLEDAAGIGGLQSRRHEAELKLKSAETNLAQLDLILENLQTQQAGLRRQAQQAEKYRKIADRLRETQALFFHCIWKDALEKLKTSKQAFDSAEALVRDALVKASAAEAREAEMNAALPALRATAAKADDVLRVATKQHQRLEAEQYQLSLDQNAAERELAQSKADQAHESRQHSEAADMLGRLAKEADDLNTRLPVDKAALTEAEEQQRLTEAQALQIEEAILTLTSSLTKTDTLLMALSQQETDFSRRQQTARQSLEKAQKELAGLSQIPPENIIGFSKAVETARAELTKAEAAINETQTLREVAEAAVKNAREVRDDAKTELTILKAEISGLETSLHSLKKSQNFAPILDEIQVQPGYETVLAAALGADLNAAAAPAAPHRWTELPGKMTPLPHGIPSLHTYVKAPPSLERALSAVGVVTEEDAKRWYKSLLPGQTLVTEAGALFRWDGLVRETDNSEAEGIILARRNRLRILQDQLLAVTARAEASEAAFNAQAQSLNLARGKEHTALNAVSAAFQALRQAETTFNTARNLQETQTNHRERLQEIIQAAQQNVDESEEALATLKEQQQALPDAGIDRSSLEEHRARLSTIKTRMSEIGNQVNQCLRRIETNKTRLSTIVAETTTWQARITSWEDRSRLLARRQIEAETKLAGFTTRPQQIVEEIQIILDEVTKAEHACRVCNDAIIEAETSIAGQRQKSRAAQEALSAAREARARYEMGVEAAQTILRDVELRIADELKLTPESLAQAIADDSLTFSREQLEQKLASLVRDRDTMGPVNLRAETELEDIAVQITTLETEKSDLVEAIASLRQAIAKLNREARERLNTAFETVRTHFKRLFTDLFGGGEADLSLTGLDDPLEAGLEIFASPPGKKLQILSLLSGGEQALTALALLFAMFLTTPAPVCVLDEVDAPLDDANVTRFCDLLDEISAQTGTRFLVITHHRVTMARMDRLYGVTMAERGVSMLVSVDLRVAETLAEQPITARA